MEKHRGKILQDVLYKWLEKSGWSVTAISKKLGYNPSSTYRHFEKEDLAYHIIRRYGKAMNHDFRVEFPEMEEDDIYNPSTADPETRGYEPITLLQAMQQIEAWKSKYYDMLEKYNQLLVTRLEEIKTK